MRRAFGIALLIVLAIITPAAVAQQCTITATPMAFGIYTGGVAQATSTITVTTCGFNSSYNLGLSAGISGNVNSRTMTGPSAPALSYGLFTDATRKSNWSTTTTVNCFLGCGNTSVTVYGQIAAGQLIVPGSFSDSVATSSPSVPIQISASFSPSCQIAVTSNLVFGSYTGAKLNSTATLSVNCTNTTIYYVNLSDGTHPICCWNSSMQSAAGAALDYTNYRESTRSTRWGNSYHVDGVAGVGTGSPQTLTVYGQVAAGQYATPGAYSDTVIATLTY